MITFSDLIAAIRAIASGIKSLSTYREKDKAIYDAGILRVYTAASESRSYIAGLKNRKAADEARERMISRLWNEAAVSLRHIDKKLADQCLVFSSSVSESTTWEVDQIDEARKSVTIIFDQARKLL